MRFASAGRRHRGGRGRQTKSLAMKFYARARNVQTNPELDLDLRKTFESYTVDRTN